MKVVRLHGDIPISSQVLFNQLLEDDKIDGAVVILKRGENYRACWTNMKVSDLCIALKVFDCDVADEIERSRVDDYIDPTDDKGEK